MPLGLEAPEGRKLVLVGHAIGTQNYICAPAATATGVDWLFLGPQATVFDAQGKQILTHFLSRNPYENDALHATWQHSRDTSIVWAAKIAGSSDASYVEAGAVDTPETERMLRGWVEPMLGRGIDVLVLGCTHYPFVIPLLNRICGPGVRVIDPAPAVARQAARVWAAQGFGATPDSAPGRLTYYTTGPVKAFEQSMARLGLERAEVRSAVWRAGKVTAA